MKTFKTFKTLMEEIRTPVSFPVSTDHHSTYVKHLDKEDALHIHRIPPTSVDVKDIRATQNHVNLSRVHKYMRDGNNGEHPEGVRHNGKVHILDGHHRAEAAVKGGAKQIKMHVFDLDAIKESLEEAKKEPIESWHGSPHDFSEFSRKNTAHTGEGGAAYGSGIYVSSHRAVGEFYRDANKKKQGKLYKVSINADPKRMMHWHKPISEQPAHVQKVLNSTDYDHESKPDAHARHIFHHLRTTSGETDRVKSSEYASKYLADRGIHGIEYHGDIEGSAKERPTNRVVFDPKRISITAKFDHKNNEVDNDKK